MLNTIGQSVVRADALEKVTGKALYVADMKMAGMLYGAVLRSPHAHARILDIDTRQAQALPGVVCVLTGEQTRQFSAYGPVYKDQRIVAGDKVRYVGDPVALVAAESPAAAKRALHLIKVRYQPLPAVFNALEALQGGAPLLHPKEDAPDSGGNLVDLLKIRHGDIEAGFAEADQLVEDVFTTSPLQHASIETHAAVAKALPGERIEVWSTTQTPFTVQSQLQHIFGLPLGGVRVVAPHLGGGFGGKAYPVLEPAAAALAWCTGRPVKLVVSREEEFALNTRHAATVKIKSGVRNDGRITARHIQIYWNTGAYATCGPRTSRLAGAASNGPYNIPNVWVDSHCVYTNCTPAGAMRGFGVPQVSWAQESHMDIIAERLGMDPLELRLKNTLQSEERYITGEPIYDIDYDKLLKKAAQDVDWAENEQGEQPDGTRRGKGLACALQFSYMPSTSTAMVKVLGDASVLVYASTAEMGQGAQTVYNQIVAQELGVPYEKVRIVLPDTSTTPFDSGTNGSRSVFNMGNALLLATKDAKEKLLKTAAGVLGVPVGQLAFEEGAVLEKATKKRLTIGELAAKTGNIIGTGSYVLSGTPLDLETGQGEVTFFWMSCAGGVEVEVNPATGDYTVKRYAGALDVGRALNPKNCEQQHQGAVVMALGQLKTEQILRNPEGEVLNANFVDYKIPTFQDIPEKLLLSSVEVPHRGGPYGAKGIGEVPVSPPLGAVSNAIYRATGVRIKELPITPEKLFFALRAQAETKAGDEHA